MLRYLLLLFMRTSIILLFYFLVAVFSLKADNPYSFKSLTTTDGLSDGMANCMHVDSKGFLWIGTNMGLNRFDGYAVEQIGRTFCPQLQYNIVADIQEDMENNLWIYCKYEYYIYNINTRELVTDVRGWLKEKGVDIGNSFYVTKVDDKGSLWIITSEQIIHYDYQDNSVKIWKIPVLNINDIVINHCTATSEMIVLAGRQCIMQFKSSTGKLEPLVLPVDMQREDNIYAAFIDADRSLWVYSYVDENICRYTMGGKIVKEMIDLSNDELSELHNNAIRDMIDDGRGNLWIATDHKGLIIYEKSTGKRSFVYRKHNTTGELLSNNVISLAIDKQGTIWASHNKMGISYTTPNPMMFDHKGNEYGVVSTIFCDSKGRRWIGTDGWGLYYEQEDGTSVKYTFPNITVSSIAEDEEGTLWVGTYNNGLFHILPNGRYEQFSLSNGKFPMNNIWRLLYDKDGYLWCTSSVTSLVKMNLRTMEWEEIKDEKQDIILGTDFATDKRGNILISTTYGLILINKDKVRRLTTNFKGSQNMDHMMINTLCYDKKQDILLLGYLQGLGIFDFKYDTIYTIHNKVNDNDVCAQDIVLDQNGTFWVSNSNSISNIKVNRSKEGLIEYNVRNYTERELLVSPTFNANSSALTRDGNIILGRQEGYSIIYPDKVNMIENTIQKPVIFSVKAGERLINTDNGIATLEHDETHLTVRYFNGVLNNASSVRYAYKLEGMMNQWTYTDENHITFVGLAPGDYKLLLKEAEGDDNQTAVLEIHVNKIFYLTTWAFFIYALLICAFVWALWRWSKQKQLRQLKSQREKLEREKQAQITEMKLRFFTNISHDLRTPLTLIISPLDMVVKKLDEGVTPNSLVSQLKNVRKNAQLLLNQVGSLLDFRRLDVGTEALVPSTSDIIVQLSNICLSFRDFADERGINLTFDTVVDTFMMTYDKEKMNKILYNLLSNAFKFTEEGGNVSVRFSYEGSMVSIVVADTGKGIQDKDKIAIFNRFFMSASNDSNQTGSGIGLHIVKEYVTMHGGTVSVSDNKPKGSVFSVCLPIGKPVQTEKIDETTHPLNDGEQNSQTENRTILVVDDNKEMIRFISDGFSEYFIVLTAENGQQALNLLETNNISLVISDVMMPIVDGFELCKKMKSNIKTSHIPLILLTARATDESQLNGLQLGADDYITKPFNLDVLRLRVQKFMEWSETNHNDFKKKIDIAPSEITITPLDEQFIQKAIGIVEEHISDSDFSVEHLGRDLGMSRSFLYKKLMAITGVGPSEFIRTIRIKRGLALLEKSQMQISEIAYQVGFNSLKSFSMNFKAEFGVTPSEYLKKLKK